MPVASPRERARASPDDRARDEGTSLRIGRPKPLDEKDAALHLDKVGAKLTKLSDKQAKYLGLPAQRPFKTQEYRY